MKAKQNNIRRKSIVMIALVAVLFVLHAFVTSNATMAELAFPDNALTQELVETSLNDVSADVVSNETSVGQ